MVVVMLLLPIGITISFIFVTKSDREGREKGHQILTLFNLFAIFWLSKFILLISKSWNLHEKIDFKSQFKKIQLQSLYRSCGLLNTRCMNQ